MRVRSFTQDDAHIFMLPSQIKSEIQGVIDLFNTVYSTFGLSYHAELSTKPEKAMGSDEVWEITTNALREALDERVRHIASMKVMELFMVLKLTFI